MNVNKQIQKHFNKANELALNEVERIVRSVLTNNSKLGGFFMSMGTYCFEDLQYNNLNDYESQRLNNFIAEWDRSLCVTGNSICLRKQGNRFVKITDW